MNEDFSEVLNQFSKILKEKNIDLNSVAGGNPPPAQDSSNESANNSIPSSDQNTNNPISSNDGSDFSLDIETIMKIKDIISKMNKSSHSPRNNLLKSLKPYLENDKQEKLESYIKIANLLSVMEDLDLGMTFFKDTKKGYDFILIITLFLLII